MKKKIAFLVIILICISIVVIYSVIKGKAELTVSVGNHIVKYKACEDHFTSNNFVFKFAFEDENLEYIENVDIGGKIYRELGNNSSEEFIIRDYLLNAEGEIIHDDIVCEVPVIYDNDKYYFVVKTHKVLDIISKYKLISPDNVEDYYRGFMITTTKGNTKKDYMFVIKTN
ncbi:hypothetical protein SH1V18_30460 [Vallitalea longa]|uniref:Uncharacterized protein n=1 Tax=Vallitalea longa TaxID=2936439 RepID=A0A9W5YDE1_9FIRM|nr:hypothetical protein [Vallitalea longa]GKX30566.1 hypothetical protein SH1V18_30460 [Vallitalea longa]